MIALIIAVAKPVRHLVMQMQFFCVYRPYKELVSKEMNNDNDLDLHSLMLVICYVQLVVVCTL